MTTMNEERVGFEHCWAVRNADDEGNLGAKPLRSEADPQNYRGSAVQGSWVWFQRGAAWQRAQDEVQRLQIALRLSANRLDRLALEFPDASDMKWTASEWAVEARTALAASTGQEAMSSEELKPCPFCGGDVSFHKDEECLGCHLIQCGQCRAFFDFATGADPGNDCASVDALRAAIVPIWNTRAELAAIKGQEPNGWRLVPTEPTAEMLAAAWAAPIPAVWLDSISARDNLVQITKYRAMLAAAPAQPAVQAEETTAQPATATVLIKRELLERILPVLDKAAFYKFGDPVTPDSKVANDLRTELLASLAQQGEAVEVVGYQQLSRYGNWDRVDKAVYELGKLGDAPQKFRALYAHPASVPAGCKVVPVELLGRAHYHPG